jgi:hypothetical protein
VIVFHFAVYFRVSSSTQFLHFAKQFTEVFVLCFTAVDNGIVATSDARAIVTWRSLWLWTISGALFINRKSSVSHVVSSSQVCRFRFTSLREATK